MRRPVLRLMALGVVSFLVLMWVLFFPAASGHHGLHPTHAHVAVGGDTPRPTTAHAPQRLDFFVGAPKVQCPDTAIPQHVVDQHSTAADLWLAIDGSVLNLTEFVPHHPGGTAILGGVGGDAAELFTHYHQPGTVGLFSKFCVGRLATAAP